MPHLRNCYVASVKGRLTAVIRLCCYTTADLTVKFIFIICSISIFATFNARNPSFQLE